VPITDDLDAVINRTDLVSARTSALAMLPPVTVGMRQLQPTEVSFDLRVIRGEWVDTGLPWALDGRYAGTALLPETISVDGRDVVVSYWSFDLRPMSGVYLDDGFVWPSLSDQSYPPMVVETSTALVDIYIKSGAADRPTYIKWPVRHAVDAGENYDVWETDRVYEATRLSNGSFAQGQRIIQPSQVECAIKPTTAFDFSGGSHHGNEEALRTAVWMIDGAAIDPADAFTFAPSRIELIQETQLLHGGPNFATRHTAAGPAFVELVRHALWTRDEGLTLRHHVTEVDNGVALEFAFFGMAPIQRIDSDDGVTQITHTAMRPPLWEIEDVSTPGFTIISTTADRVKVFGDRYSADVSMTEGWVDASRLVYVDNRALVSSNYNKVYPGFFRGGTHVTSIGVTYDTEVTIQIGITETANG